MAAQRGIAIDNRVQDSDFEDCDALLEGRMGDGWQLFFQTPDVQVGRQSLRSSSPSRASPCSRRSTLRLVALCVAFTPRFLCVRVACQPLTYSRALGRFCHPNFVRTDSPPRD